MINLSLTIGNQILYAVILGILTAVGLSPGLGIIHCHRRDSLVFDIADLFKAETSIPVAFDLGGDSSIGKNRIDRETRKEVREKIRTSGMLKRTMKELRELFPINDNELRTYTQSTTSEFDCSSIDDFDLDDLIWIDEDGGLWSSAGIREGHSENRNDSKD